MSDKPEIADLTIRVLQEIRDEAQDQLAPRRDQLALDKLQAETHRGFEALRGETQQGFELLGRRIDNVLLGEHRHEHQELRERVERIEQHLGLRPQ